MKSIITLLIKLYIISAIIISKLIIFINLKRLYYKYIKEAKILFYLPLRYIYKVYNTLF
jgi:hypothetical protein